MYKLFIVLLFFVIFIFYFYHNSQISENFVNYCDCNKFSYSPNQCLSCANCGLCINSYGQTKCVQGDINGPIFEKDCVRYRPGGLMRRPFMNRIRNIWEGFFPIDNLRARQNLRRRVYMNNMYGSERIYGRRFRPRYGERYDPRYDLYKTDEDED
jgi:hypothetical protein